MSFKFIDLFSGIGGFHAALTAAGGECVYAVEIDKDAAAIYERNWGMNPLGDITCDANESTMKVPEHDVLCAGFPCQPFSKSGAQKGMDETRGTLYWNILRIIQVRKPSVVILENVRNLAGPRHKHEWEVIIRTLRDEGYKVSDVPAILSPHLLPLNKGGRPQARERVFITATRFPTNKRSSEFVQPVVTNKPIYGWNPQKWRLNSDLPLQSKSQVKDCDLSDSEELWISAWAEFVELFHRPEHNSPLPGFPLWADEWKKQSRTRLQNEPSWKSNFLSKNENFYFANQKKIDRWTKKWGIYSDDFPASRRKFEWQAQDTKNLWSTVMHFRPSGLRAKAPTYLPALVAINHGSIIGSKKRRLSVREAARLQGLPEWFDFGDQPARTTYKQLGNGVSIGVIWNVFKAHVERDEELLKEICPSLLKSLKNSPMSPDEIVKRLKHN